MRAITGSRLILFAVAALALHGGRAEAQVSDEANCGATLPACTALRTNCCTRNFASTTTQKALLIPMDRCHQPFTNASGTGADIADTAPQWCSGSPSPNVNAQNYAYGLVYRLMQNKVPVYWIVNPTKAPSTNGITATSVAASTKDVDFWVTTAAATPPSPSASLTGAGGQVRRLTVNNVGLASLSYTTAATYARDQFSVRGGAFVIAPEDRTLFDNFMKTQAGRSSCGSGTDCYNFFSNNGLFLYEIQPGAKLVWQDYTQPLSGGRYAENIGALPVAMRIDYAPPKVAVVPGTTMLGAILDAANLNDIQTTAGCKTGSFDFPNRIGCQLTEADVVTNNRLVTSVFDNAWVDLASPSSCSSFAAKLQLFATSLFGVRNGGNIIMFGDSINVAEQCAAARGALLGRAGTGLAMHGSSVNDSDATPYIIRYPSNLLAQYGDLPLNFASGSVKAWDRVTGTTDLYSLTYRPPSLGGTSTGGNTLRRLMTQEVVGTFCSNHNDSRVTGGVSPGTCDSGADNTTSADFRDAFAYGRYLNDKRNGLIFYSPGQNPNTNPVKSHMKLILGTLLAVPPFLVDQVFNNVEVARSSPIVASIGGTSSKVQGTYEYRYKEQGTPPTQFPVPRTLPTVFVPDDVANWSFPAMLGHLRGVSTASIGVTASNLNVGTSTLHAASGEGTGSADTFPAVNYVGCSRPFDGTCRAVWTTTTTGVTPTSQQVRDGNTAVSTLMLPEAGFANTDPNTGRTYRDEFMRKILRGYDNGTGYVAMLGGIDRSTVAVIGPGTSVGVGPPPRATIAYVGGMDGMLHAICASESPAAGCPRIGMELWAYIPRTNLGQLRYNQARVDGSPRVLDVKLTTGSKTVLVVQAGNDPTVAGATPAIYALDVTNPQQPSVLWEYATWDSAAPVGLGTPNARPVNGLGVGLALAAGQANITSGIATVEKNIVIAQTNNGGTGSNGNYVIAIDMSSGERIWERFDVYPSTTIATGLFNGRLQPTVDIPSSAIPPGPVPVDKFTNGKNAFMTHIVVADLAGNLWLLDPNNGSTVTRDASNNQIPLFQHSQNFHPLTRPAIYSDGGILHAAFTTGGYHDYTAATQWGFNSATPQHLISVNLFGSSPTTPFTENSGAPRIAFKQDVTGYGYSQVRVVNTDVLGTTDTTNINLATFGTSTAQTGRVFGFNVTGTDTAITNIAATSMGASTVANDGLQLYVSSGSKHQRLGDTGGGAGTPRNASSTPGERTTAPRAVTETIRRLWLRTE